MIFLGVVPLAVGGFGNYVLPLQIGAPDMAFPRINMMSYWAYFLGGVTMLASFFLPQGTATSGWTAYPPLAIVAETGETVWLIGMALLITSSLLGSINFIATVIQLRTRGLRWMRLPFFVWSQFVTAFLLLLAFPPLERPHSFSLWTGWLGPASSCPADCMWAGRFWKPAVGETPSCGSTCSGFSPTRKSMCSSFPPWGS